MASSKRKQDEKHLKMLREMAALPPNKQCFDCHQRGPTYVNMTVGSFVCTSCSGILRGLNPPHRVKSISMASFTPEEMEIIKMHGNELCRKVYLGLYDARSGMEPDSRDEQKVKDFMIQKYERKRYYVAPTESMKAEAKLANEAAMNKQPATRPLKKLLGEKTPSIIASQNEQSPKQTLKSQAASVPGQITLGQQPQKDTSFQSPGQQSQSSQSSGSATMDLLGDLGGDPFSASAPPPPQASSGGDHGGFADFSSFNQFGSQTKPVQQPVNQSSFSGFPTSNNPLVPFGNTQTASSSLTNGSTTQPVSIAAPSGGDRYSALTDLFSSSPVSTGPAPAPVATNVNWGGSSDLNWGDTGSTTSTAGSGLNWNSTSSQGGQWKSSNEATSTYQGVDWMSPANSSSSTNTSSLIGGNPNPFGGNAPSISQSGTSTSNPFGGFGQQQSTTAFGQQQTTAGFGQQQPMPGFGQQQSTPGFGQQQPASGFGQQQPASGFGQQQPASGFGQHPAASGFGQQPTSFGQPAQPTIGGFNQTPTASFGQSSGWGGGQQENFGQFPMQNGGFSSATGFGGQTGTPATGQFSSTGGVSGGGFGTQQSFSMGQGGFQPAWNQSATSANPYMSAATQQMTPKTNSTNPFL